MAYNLTLSSGTPLVTIADGTTDTTYTSLTLVGKNFAGYGQFLNENYVAMLENFANTTPPANPLQGQLWWNTTLKTLCVLNGTTWKNVSSTTSSSTSPTNSGIGDLWWDTVNGQLKVYTGQTWTVIGPAYTATQGQTGAVADTVTDSLGQTSYVVVKFYINNLVVAVLSNAAQQFSVTSLPGFPIIYPGFTMSATNAGGSGELKYYGNADNSLHLGGQPAASYLRNDIPGTLSGNLSILGSSGLSVGLTNPGGSHTDYLTFSTGGTATSTSTIASTVAGMGLNLSINDSVSGVTPVISLLRDTTINQTYATLNGDPPIDPAHKYDYAIATRHYVQSVLGTSSATGQFSGQVTGVLTSTGGELTRTGVPVMIAEIDTSIYRSATFNVQAVNADSGQYHAVSLTGIHDGAGSADSVEYGAIDIRGQVATFSVAVSGSQLQLMATPYVGGTVFKVTTFGTFM
jgi:hypothetical protein